MLDSVLIVLLEKEFVKQYDNSAHQWRCSRSSVLITVMFWALLQLVTAEPVFVRRQICVDDGQELSLQYGCQFYEVSAAENFAGVSLAFQSLLREARSVQLLRALPIRRKLGVNSVSKVLGNIFGKNNKTGDRKKRPSLSI